MLSLVTNFHSQVTYFRNMSFTDNSILKLKMALSDKKCAIEESITLLEEDQKSRAQKIEEILKEELNKTLQAICKSDSEVVANLKDSGFESIHLLNSLLAEAEGLEISEGVKDLEPKSIAELENKMASVKFVEKIEMAVQPNMLKAGFAEIPKAFLLHSSYLNAKQFKLEIPQQNLPLKESMDDHESFDLHISKMNSATNFSQHELENLIMAISCHVPGKEEKQVVKVGSVASRMMKIKAEISDEKIIVQVKRPNNIIGQICVKVLGSNIINSPILHHFFYSEDKEPSNHNLTSLDESVSIFDMTMTGLNRFDQLKLEKTRRQVLLGASKCNSIPESPLPLDVGVSCRASIWEPISEDEEEHCEIDLSDRVSVFPTYL